MNEPMTAQVNGTSYQRVPSILGACAECAALNHRGLCWKLPGTCHTPEAVNMVWVEVGHGAADPNDNHPT